MLRPLQFIAHYANFFDGFTTLWRRVFFFAVVSRSAPRSKLTPHRIFIHSRVRAHTHAVRKRERKEKVVAKMVFRDLYAVHMAYTDIKTNFALFFSLSFWQRWRAAAALKILYSTLKMLPGARLLQ
jgi:hypothetical protein